MKKTIILCCILSTLFIQNIFSQTLGELYTEKNAGFSMSMPKGWQTFDANQKYLMIAGPADNGFTPNIGFADDAFTGSLSEYIEALTAALGQIYTNLTIIKKSNFSTGSGLRGEYVIIQGRMGEISVRQIMYIFSNPNNGGVLGVTATAPLANGEKYDPIFDECVKTFKWTK